MQLVRMSIYSLGKPHEYKHNFNSLDKANIKSHNYRCSIYLIQFDLYYEAFETVPYVTRIVFFFKD